MLEKIEMSALPSTEDIDHYALPERDTWGGGREGRVEEGSERGRKGSRDGGNEGRRKEMGEGGREEGMEGGREGGRK